MMERYDVVIIGAGISGLSFAYQCSAAGKKVAVLEKGGRVGGCFHSHKCTGEAEGFWLELGAHTCYNSYVNLIELLEKVRLTNRITARQKVPFKIYADAKIASVPSRIDFIELLISAPRLFTHKKEGESVQSYYSRIVGKRNYEKVFSPAFNAVLSQPAAAFPAEMLFKKRSQRRKEVARSFTMPEGLQEITNTFADHPGINVVLNTEIQSVDHSGNEFEVVSVTGERYAAPALVMAVPPPSAAGLLAKPFPELSAVLGRIKTESVETMGVAVPKERISLPPLAGIIGISEPFYSVVSRDTVPHERWRGFAFHFKPGLVSQEQKMAKVCEVLNISGTDIAHTVHKNTVLPALTVGHDRIVSDIDRLISGKPLFITGNYFLGLAIEDCVMRSRSEFGRMIG